MTVENLKKALAECERFARAGGVIRHTRGCHWGRKVRLPARQIGSRIWFEGESRPYRVRAGNHRFLVCTKPHNNSVVGHTVLYTVIDFARQVRSTEGLVFGLGAETDKQCEEMTARLHSGETELSKRNEVRLKITRTEAPA